MKPVTVSTEVAAPPAQVFEYLDTLANHEALPRPLPGQVEVLRAGAAASAPRPRRWPRRPARRTGSSSRSSSSEAPRRIVEEGVSSGGKRKTRGTYRLERGGRRHPDRVRARVPRAAALRAPRPVPDPRLRQAGQRQGDAPPRQAARRLRGSPRGRGGARRPGGAAGAAGADRGRGAARRGGASATPPAGAPPARTSPTSSTPAPSSSTGASRSPPSAAAASSRT